MFKNNTNNNTLYGLRLNILVCLFLSLITLAVYWQVTSHEFINLDDPIYVTENKHIQKGLTPENIVWAFNFTDKRDVYWHPLTWFSHMLDCQGYGLNPGMHHLSSLIFHMANGVLLFLVFKRMTGSLWKSAFVAALFALHPINVDSVAWIAERKNVLSTFFWMLTLLSYAYYCERPRTSRYLLTFLAFVLGLLAKPMLITLPFVLLLLDYWPLGRLRSSTKISASLLVLEKVPFLIISAISIYVSTSSLKGFNSWISFEQTPMSLRISNAFVSYVSYIGKMIWPQNLAVFYPYPHMIPIWKIACSGLFLIFVSLLVVLAAKKRSYLAVGWFWFLGTLVPVIGLAQAGLWPALADRWAYVPFIGLYIMIAWGATELLNRWPKNRIVLAATAVMILSILTSATLIQLRYWTNSITLFEHALEVTTNNFVGHNNLAVAYAKQEDLTKVIHHHSETLKINPGFMKAHNDIGIALSKQNNIDEAIKHFALATELDPYYAEAFNNLGFSLTKKGRISDAITQLSEALRIDPNHVSARNNMGLALMGQGMTEKAMTHFSEAIRINPDYAGSYNNLGFALSKRGEMANAIAQFSKALQIDPEYADAHNNLGISLQSQGKIIEAIDCFSEAIRINPEHAISQDNLGFALAIQGRIPEAIIHFAEALRISPENARVHNHMGMTLANQGNFSEAIKHFSEAIRIAPTYDEARNNLTKLLTLKNGLE